MVKDRIGKAILGYRERYRDDPKGILLGPTEWMDLMHDYHSREAMFGVIRHGPGGDTFTFMGIKCYPKTLPGVDVIPRNGVVGYYAKELDAR